MKSILYAAVAASALAVPLASFAQSSEPVTRDQVKAELLQLERNGYQPEASDAQYPANIQAAEARIQPAQQQTLARADTSGFGTMPASEGQSGRRMMSAPNPVNSVYFGQ